MQRFNHFKLHFTHGVDACRKCPWGIDRQAPERKDIFPYTLEILKKKQYSVFQYAQYLFSNDAIL
jgi:hypothetical protein